MGTGRPAEDYGFDVRQKEVIGDVHPASHPVGTRGVGVASSLQMNLSTHHRIAPT